MARPEAIRRARLVNRGPRRLLRQRLEVEAARVPVAGVLAVAVDADADGLVRLDVVVAVDVVAELDAGDAEAGRADGREAADGDAVEGDDGAGGLGDVDVVCLVVDRRVEQ